MYIITIFLLNVCLIMVPSIDLAGCRQYEEKQLKGQQERARRRLEFANQVSRLQNQLAYEKQRDTSGLFTLNVFYVYMYIA